MIIKTFLLIYASIFKIILQSVAILRLILDLSVPLTITGQDLARSD